MSVFKRRRFPAEIILICVRWYCKYGISYRDLAEMMQERGVAVDHTTIVARLLPRCDPTPTAGRPTIEEREAPDGEIPE